MSLAGPTGSLVSFSLLVFGVAYWVFTTDWNFPVAMMTLSGGCLFFMGVLFFKEACRDFTSEDFFESFIGDRRYRQVISRKNHFETFDVGLDEIDDIERKHHPNSKSASSYSIVLLNGQKKKATDTYWNPRRKIMKH